MKIRRAIILAALLGLTGQAANAFQETKGSAQQDDAAQSAVGPDVKLNAPSSSTPPGQELKLPGIGSIGTLPKLDFGLELLYGNNPGSAPSMPSDDKADSGAQIRGTLKYRFPN